MNSERVTSNLFYTVCKLFNIYESSVFYDRDLRPKIHITTIAVHSEIMYLCNTADCVYHESACVAVYTLYSSIYFA